MPKCSIILTSYNQPKFLREAIDSIFRQTIDDWQLIVVDSSTDPEIKDILQGIDKDPRVLILTQPRSNISYAWNRGLDQAKGEYITILDHDNRKRPEFCERMSRYLDEHQDYDVVASFQEPIDRDGNPISKDNFRKPVGADKESILKRNYIDSNEPMFRKTLFDKIGYWDERLSTLEDWDFFIRVLYETKGIAILPEYLGEYRLHPDQRTQTTLGFNPNNIELIRSKKHGVKLKVSCISPNPNKLTLSQNQVCRGILASLYKIPFVSVLHTSPITGYDKNGIRDADFVLLLCPFRIEADEMEKLAELETPIVTMHMEDPQILSLNAERAKLAHWVVSNDIVTIPYYQKIIDPKKVLFCPSLSISQDVLKIKAKRGHKFDVILCGYAYDSRVEFMEEFLKEPLNFRLLLLGDNWKEKLKKRYRSLFIIPTRNEIATMRIYRSAKIIICLHRDEKDIGGFPLMKSESIHRGYIEAYSGALVMIDNKRPQHSFGPDEVVFFSSPEDLREKIKYYLAHPKIAKAMAKKAQMRATRDFTFRARLTKILNCIRSQRYNMLVP